MKSVIKLTAAFVLGLMALAGCSSDDGYSLDDRYYAYGTVVTEAEGATRNYNVKLDNGSVLYVAANLVADLYRNDDRVYVNFTILGDMETPSSFKDYSVRLNGLYWILSKQPVRQSAIVADPALDDQLGHDPIKMDKAVFSGKYLNVHFYFAGTQRPPEKHFVNIVHDDVDVTEGKAVITMRHNAYGDSPGQGNTSGFGYHASFISFDISSLIPEGETEVEVTLRWTQYKDGTWLETEDKQSVGTFRRNSAGMDSSEYNPADSFVE